MFHHRLWASLFCTTLAFACGDDAAPGSARGGTADFGDSPDVAPDPASPHDAGTAVPDLRSLPDVHIPRDSDVLDGARPGEDMFPVFLPPKDTGPRSDWALPRDAAAPPPADARVVALDSASGPEDAFVLPDVADAAVLSDSAPIAPDAATLAPDAAIPVPDAAALTPDAATVAPDAAIPVPDAAPPAPDAAPPPDAAHCPPPVIHVLQPGPEQSKDIWTDPNYAYDDLGGGPGGGRDDDELRVTTREQTFLEFDLTGLPATADRARIELFPHRTGREGVLEMDLARITAFWDWRLQGTGRDRERLWWADRPPTVPLGGSLLPAPVVGEWYSIDITGLYRAWQSGALPAHGIALTAVRGENRINLFWSANFEGDPELRPRLVVETGACEAPQSPCDPTNASGLCAQVCLGDCGDGVCRDAERCDACPIDCPCPDGCGNGTRDPGEACDDGNRVDTDLCSNACALQTISAASSAPDVFNASLVRMGDDVLLLGWTDVASAPRVAHLRALEATGVDLGPDVDVAADAAGLDTLIRELVRLDDTTALVLFQKGPELFGRRFTTACLPVPIDPDDELLGGASFMPDSESRVEAAALPGGGFAIVWSSTQLPSADADGEAVYLRRFGADGQPTDPGPVLVNADTVGHQTNPAIAVDSAGTVTVVWQDGLDANRRGASIRGRRFGLDGAPGGPEFTVSTPPENTVRYPLVATLPDDVLLVVWSDRGQQTDTAFQRFDRMGVPLDAVKAIANVYRPGRQAALGLVVNERGEFLVGYDDGHGCESGCPDEISRGRVFHANGQPIDAGERAFPNSHAAFVEGVALPDGSFRILYGDNGWHALQMRQVNVRE